MNTRYLIPICVLFLIGIVWFTSSFDDAIATKTNFYILDFPIVSSDYEYYHLGLTYRCFDNGDGWMSDGGFRYPEGEKITKIFQKVEWKSINDVNDIEMKLGELCKKEAIEKQQNKEQRIKELVNELQELIEN